MKFLFAALSIRPRRRRWARGAMTLVEVMVVVALTSIMLGVVISLFVGLLRWNHTLRDRSVRSEQLTHLAEAMRTDIRQASDVSLAAEDVLQIALRGEGQARYELLPEGCRRIVEVPGAAGSRLEMFLIGPAAGWTMERGTGRRPLVMLTLDRSVADKVPAGGAPPLLVYGALGADLADPAEEAADDATETEL